MKRRSGRFWPTPLQEQLLTAALADPATAAATWRRLRPSLDIERLEPGSFELLPLVHRNLVDSGADEADDELLPRLKGIYRRSWVKNNLLLERLAATATELEAADIRALFLEGPPSALRYYGNVGLRPTSFFHLLVDEPSMQRALSRLPRAGWTTRVDGSDGRSVFSDAGGNGCTVRATLAYDFVAPTGSSPLAPLWSAAERQQAGETEVLVPCPTDALLVECVTGARKHSIRDVQWIADAVLILRHGGIDWDRLLELGTGHGQTLRLHEALAYLSELPGSPVAGAALSHLAEAPIGPRERIGYVCAGGAAPRLGALPEILAEHLAATTRESPARAIASFPARLRDRWRLAHVYDVPLAAARRACSRLFSGGAA